MALGWLTAAAQADAGDYYDPAGTGRHAGPYGDGHPGDLPNLIGEQDGTVTIPVLAPRLMVKDIQNRALMIHAAPDRYAAHGHHRHGKGGARMYCGVIP
jgi:Cu-Zn family superoxide dismutase